MKLILTGLILITLQVSTLANTNFKLRNNFQKKNTEFEIFNGEKIPVDLIEEVILNESQVDYLILKTGILIDFTDIKPSDLIILTKDILGGGG